MRRSPQRIGTWNLDAKTSAKHVEFLRRLNCDVLLLTEVAPTLRIDGYRGHFTQAEMARQQRWAAIFSKAPLDPRPDPHGASVLAVIDGIMYCSSILPWRTCGERAPWSGANVAERTKHAVEGIVASRPTVWGGDWNHSFVDHRDGGRETVGSLEGRSAIQHGVNELGLRIVTERSPHRIEGLFSIDHIALPLDWGHGAVRRVAATGLSDHDAYVVETA